MGRIKQHLPCLYQDAGPFSLWFQVVESLCVQPCSSFTQCKVDICRLLDKLPVKICILCMRGKLEWPRRAKQETLVFLHT